MFQLKKIYFGHPEGGWRSRNRQKRGNVRSVCYSVSKPDFLGVFDYKWVKKHVSEMFQLKEN